MSRHFSFSSLSLVLLLLLASGASSYARDAAFLDPGSGMANANDEAVKVDPKAEIDVGETNLGAAKRTSIFFVNQTNQPIKIEKVVVNNDANVTAEATADDCMKQGVIAPLSRCSVEVSITATSPGAWSTDVLMTHNGAGRIARAKLTGKTSGSGSADGKSTGLAVNTKEVKPIDFGDVTVGDGKIVRTTLMINDSAEPITIFSIDVIEADNGLQKLDQGCAVDMELAPGASCPVTLLWVPKNGGPISTDLIIRHSGKLGFAVMPIRGVAKGDAAPAMAGDARGGFEGIKHDVVPLPPSATELEKEMAGKVTPLPEAALGGSGGLAGDGGLHLIGTIGEKALFLKPSGETEVVAMGGEFESGTKTAKIVAISSRSVDIVIDGKRKTLNLQAAPSLVSQAAQQAQQDTASSASTSTMSGGKK